MKIDSKHRLTHNGRLVERIMSRYTGGKFSSAPSTTVMHFTYGASARSSANWFDDPKNKYKSSAHVVVSRDGSVIQCVDFDTAANHAGKSFWKGKSGLNGWSFGIELANWGYLQPRGNGSWTSYTDMVVHNPILASHKNGNPDGSNRAIGWEPYPEAQIETAAEIVRLLSEKYGSQEIIGHDDISVGRKWDPGPAFDMAYFKQLAAEDNSESDNGLLIVNTPNDTLNLRKGPGTNFDIIKELKHGTLLQPMQFDGWWVMVNVLDDDLVSRSTGWINRYYTNEV